MHRKSEVLSVTKSVTADPLRNTVTSHRNTPSQSVTIFDKFLKNKEEKCYALGGEVLREHSCYAPPLFRAGRGVTVLREVQK